MAFNGKSQERLGKDVGSHFLSGEEVDLNVTVSNFLSDPLHLDVNVFHLAVMLRIFEDLDSRLVVYHEWRWSVHVESKFA